jgi:murein L,D-transpeptidase YcbB/YkuD
MKHVKQDNFILKYKHMGYTMKSRQFLMLSVFAFLSYSALPVLQAYAQSDAAPAPHATKMTHANILDQGAINTFYSTRGGRNYWVNGNDYARANQMFQLIKDSWTHGLNPQKYHISEISNLMAHQGSDNARLELLLTDAAIRYGRDMSGMRVNAGSLGIKEKYFRQRPGANDVAAKLSQVNHVADFLHGLKPDGELYDRLQKELIVLNKQGNPQNDLLPIRFSGATVFYPGQSHTDIVKLRRYLGLSHNPNYGPDTFYDDQLASAVMNFQRSNNLSADGVIGPATLRAMNGTNQDLMQQIVANMERLRWLDQKRHDRYLMVNIPSQHLWAIENGRVVAEMNVVVGMPTRPTKQFKTDITGVRFNPTWTVPLNLKMADFKPKLANNPGYLSNKGMQVWRDGKSIDPRSINWSKVSRAEMNNLRFTQVPGDHNALGRIRILMPSDYDIYLHDTNHPEFFNRASRTLSSGCIRMQDPEAVAKFILKYNGDFSERRMAELIDRGKMIDVKAERTVPVYVVYQSIWLDDRNNLVYGPDVYKQDQQVVAQLKQQGDYGLSSQSNRRTAEMHNR